MGSINKFRMRALSLILSFSVFLSMPVFYCLADEYDDQINAMQQEEAKTQETISNLEKQAEQTREAIAFLQDERNATEENVNELKNQSASLQNTIDGYSEKLEGLVAEIEETEDAVSDVSERILKLNGELSEIQELKKEKYALLKRRIRSVYERGGKKGMLQMILESVSFKDFLNRAEYLAAMVSYDKQKLEECQALEDELKIKLQGLEAEEQEMNAYQDKLDEKYSELSELTDEVRDQLDSTNIDISSERGKLANYEGQLEVLDQTMKSLEAQTAAAQAELAKQIAARLAMKREDTSGSYAASASELEWLASTIQAEADGESYTGKLAVGSVIMNRVKSSAFPNDVKSVITQNMQFASYRSGKVELIISKGPNSTCIKAANEVLGGARVGDYLFFMTKYYADYYGISEYTMIGNHAFFYRWIVKEKVELPEEEEKPEEEVPEEEVPEEEAQEEEVQEEEEENSESEEEE